MQRFCAARSTSVWREPPKAPYGELLAPKSICLALRGRKMSTLALRTVSGATRSVSVGIPSGLLVQESDKENVTAGFSEAEGKAKSKFPRHASSRTRTVNCNGTTGSRQLDFHPVPQILPGFAHTPQSLRKGHRHPRTVESNQSEKRPQRSLVGTQDGSADFFACNGHTWNLAAKRIQPANSIMSHLGRKRGFTSCTKHESEESATGTSYKRRRIPFTAEEDRIIADMRKDGYSWSKIGTTMNRSNMSVSARFRDFVSIGRTANRKSDSFTAQEDAELLRLKEAGRSIDEMARALGRSLSGVAYRLSRLQADEISDLTARIRYPPWTQAEDDALLAASRDGVFGDALRARLPGRTMRAIFNRRSDLKSLNPDWRWRYVNRGYLAWTPAENEEIRRMRAEGKSCVQISQHFQTRSARAVRNQAMWLGVHINSKEKYQRWAPEHDEVLLRMRKEGKSLKDIAKHFSPRSYAACKLRLIKLSNDHGRLSSGLQRWSPAEKAAVLQMMSEGKSAREMAQRIPLRTHTAIRHQIVVLQRDGVGFSSRSRQRKWSPAEDETLLQMMSEGNSCVEIAQHFPLRSYNAIEARFRGIRSGEIIPNRKKDEG